MAMNQLKDYSKLVNKMFNRMIREGKLSDTSQKKEILSTMLIQDKLF